MYVVFSHGSVAVVIQYWEQSGKAVEGGARIDVRRVSSVEGPAHRAGAEGLRIAPVGGGGGLWRADLLIDLETGGECFHYHPEFSNDDVGERFFEEALSNDPRGWIENRLRDLGSLLVEAGAPDLASSLDLTAFARSLPLMLATVDAALAQASIAMTSRGSSR